MSHPCWQLSTHHGDNVILSASPETWSVHKTSCNAWWTRYWTACDGGIGIADDVIVHGMDDEEHDKNLHNLMEVAYEHGLVFIFEKYAVKKHLWPSLDVSMTRMEHTLTLLKSVQCSTCLPHRHQHSSRSSLAWSQSYCHWCYHFHLSPHLSTNSSGMAQSLHWMNHTRKLLTLWNAWSEQTLI